MLDFRVIYVTRVTYVIIYVTGVTYMICYKYDPTEHQDPGMGNKMLHREILAKLTTRPGEFRHQISILGWGIRPHFFKIV